MIVSKLPSSTSATQTISSPPPRSIKSSTSCRKYTAFVWQMLWRWPFLWYIPLTHIKLYAQLCHKVKSTLTFHVRFAAAILRVGWLQSSTSVGSLWLNQDPGVIGEVTWYYSAQFRGVSDPLFNCLTNADLICNSSWYCYASIIFSISQMT